MKLLAIDGNSIINRAFYGVRILSNSKGDYTNAIFGFMNIYLKHVAELKPDRIAVAFDMKAPTFRHTADSSYKANRKGMPEELASQMQPLKNMLELIGVKIIECKGYEADDILGTLARICIEQGSECHIVTGDRDSLQLIDENVTVRLETNKGTILYTPERFKEEYGFSPASMTDLKALMGDSSDNIPGVAGIGQKTAMTLVQNWNTIENLYENIENAGLTKGVYNKLTAGKEAASHCKWLATIVKNAPIPENLSDYDISAPKWEELKGQLVYLEMNKLQKRMEEMYSKAQPTEITEPVVEDAELQYEEKAFTEDVLVQWEQDKDFTAVYIFDGEALCLEKEALYRTTDEKLILRFFGSSINKITFGAKPHYRYAMERSCTVNGITGDAEVCAYILNPTSTAYEPESLSITYGVPMSKGVYGSLFALRQLHDTMMSIIAEQNQTELYNMELRLTEVLASMEHTGVLVDKKGVKEFGVQLSEMIEETQQIIYDEAGHEFSIGSPKQLGEVLFTEMGLPHGKKTKTGYSTNAEVLEGLSADYPIAKYILQWRQYSKLKSTYIDGLLKTVGKDGRIHTVFKQTETRTGRISSTEPNMQNIPVRTKLGSNMRRFFHAAEGCVFIDADYSQIELRILANICGDENMQKAFLNGADIHTATAAQVFGMPEDMVTSEMRSAAKAVNFGIIYGMGAFSLAKDINVSVYEANRYIKNYLARYPKVNEFMEDTVAKGKEQGYVSTYFNRRRPVPELTQSNKMMQAAGKRIAMNTPIQGTAADIIKMAMVRVYSRLKAEVPEAKLILQVHDELIVEAPKSLALKAARILGEEMQNVAKFAVPLTAEVNMGGSWYDAKG